MRKRKRRVWLRTQPTDTALLLVRVSQLQSACVRRPAAPERSHTSRSPSEDEVCVQTYRLGGDRSAPLLLHCPSAPRRASVDMGIAWLHSVACGGHAARVCCYPACRQAATTNSDAPRAGHGDGHARRMLSRLVSLVSSLSVSLSLSLSLSCLVSLHAGRYRPPPHLASSHACVPSRSSEVYPRLSLPRARVHVREQQWGSPLPAALPLLRSAATLPAATPAAIRAAASPGRATSGAGGAAARPGRARAGLPGRARAGHPGR
jgi:hypothetical protein